MFQRNTPCRKRHWCFRFLPPRTLISKFSLRLSRIIPSLLKRLVGTSGLEPPTSRLSGVRSNHLSYAPISSGGDEEDRTPDPLRARQVLSQLSYTPMSGFQDCRFFPFEVPFSWTFKIKQCNFHFVIRFFLAPIDF